MIEWKSLNQPYFDCFPITRKVIENSAINHFSVIFMVFQSLIKFSKPWHQVIDWNSLNLSVFVVLIDFQSPKEWGAKGLMSRQHSWVYFWAFLIIRRQWFPVYYCMFLNSNSTIHAHNVLIGLLFSSRLTMGKTSAKRQNNLLWRRICSTDTKT